MLCVVVAMVTVGYSMSYSDSGVWLLWLQMNT